MTLYNTMILSCMLLVLYSILDLISFMVFGESYKLEGSSMRCFFFFLLLHVVSINIPLCT